VKPLNTIHSRLDQASSTANLLTTGWDAFELIQHVAFGQAEHDPGGYATWMSVIPPACEGRDALAQAPSMPDGTNYELAIEAGDLASSDEVATMAAHLARCLRSMAEKVPGTSDQPALDRAAAAAEEVRSLLAGDG
jgi:hypothetical protein